MTKKEFYALPVPPAPEMNIPLYTERWWSYDQRKKLYQYANRKYTARMVAGMLEITAYDAPSGDPLWRTWQDSKRVFGQTLGGNSTPSEATIHSRMDGLPREWCGSPETEELIQKWIRKEYWPDTPDNLLTIHLAAWSQTKIRHKKRDEKWNRIRQEIDNAMVEIREPPKDFYRWLTRDAFRRSHYLVYRYRKGKKEATAFCTRCRHEVTLKDHRNRGKAKCPVCHTELTCISEKSLAQTNGYHFQSNAAYLQSVREGFCLRVFRAWLHIRDYDYQDAKAGCQEIARYFYNTDTGRMTKSFAWKEFGSSGETRWCRDYNTTMGMAYIYPGNLKKLFAGTAWKYIPMAELARHCGALDLYGFAERTGGNLGVEHLAKHGLWRLAAARISHSKEDFFRAKTIREAMDGLPMDEIRMLVEVNPNGAEFEMYKAIRDLERITPEKMRQMMTMDLSRNRLLLRDILSITSWHRASKYLEAQREIWPKENRYDYDRKRYRDMPPEIITVASDWKDYLQDAQTLGWDMRSEFVVFPKDLRKAHQKSIQEAADRRDQMVAQQLRPVLKEQTIFAWETKDYLIRPPESSGEIVEEGHTLRHCVGGYVKSVAAGKSIILFVRDKKSPDTPLVTVEIDPESWKIRQDRGKCNAVPPAAIEQFLEKWQRRLQGLKEARERERIRIV